MHVRVDQSLIMIDIHINFRVDVRGMVRCCCLKSDLNLVRDGWVNLLDVPNQDLMTACSWNHRAPDTSLIERQNRR